MLFYYNIQLDLRNSLKLMIHEKEKAWFSFEFTEILLANLTTKL